MPWRRSPRKAFANPTCHLEPAAANPPAAGFRMPVLSPAESPLAESPSVTNSLLHLQDIRLAFGRLNVLKGVSFDIYPGEIVALVGDNGAGKSSLIKVITGVHKPTSGEIIFKGEKITLSSVARSRALGIETVYQERALADQQELWRNVFVGRELTKALGFLDIKRQKEETRRLLRDYMGFTSEVINVDSEVRGLSGGEKQGVAIARALYFNAELIILDEPTTGLALSEQRKVLDFIRNIRDKGKSAIFIDHNIFHVHDVADRFIILDKGQVAAQFTKAEISRDQLIDMMVELHQKGAIAS
jgi:simple sugar transport system ATP-binding protein